MKNPLKIPAFKTEDQERNFWSTVDLSKHFAAKDFTNVSFPNLKPSSRSISMRLPDFLLIRLKEEANELNIPYQSLIKKYIAQGLFQKSWNFRHTSCRLLISTKKTPIARLAIT